MFLFVFSITTFLICFRCLSENKNNYYIKSINKILITGRIKNKNRKYTHTLHEKLV